MLTLYHAPMSRSTSMVALIHELGAADKVAIETVEIPRADGSGGRDERNPHPEGKVPLLVHDGQLIRERPAITAYLTTLFPDAGLAPETGTPEWGAYLGWLAYYGDVMEPVLVHTMAGLSHPYLDTNFRGPVEMAAQLAEPLGKHPYLLGDRFSAADLLLHSPFAWLPDATPDRPEIRDWVRRCMERPIARQMADADRAALAGV